MAGLRLDLDWEAVQVLRFPNLHFGGLPGAGASMGSDSQVLYLAGMAIDGVRARR